MVGGGGPLGVCVCNQHGVGVALDSRGELGSLFVQLQLPVGHKKCKVWTVSTLHL